MTHLPWTGLPEHIALPLNVSLWALALVWAGWVARGVPGWKVGLASGVISALVGLLVLGSRLTEKSVDDHQAMHAARLVPNAGLIIAGFLATGAVLGAICGAVGAVLRGQGAAAPGQTWLARFALVCVLCTAPLLFIGGLVTSTNSGMAVPDWPNTYGTNMFLYPLGPRMNTAGVEEPQKIFLEHSHRLFGTLVGLVTLVLMIWSLRSRITRGLKVLAIGCFALVCAQGVLGGIRVLQGHRDLAEDNRWYAMAHGILGQLTFCLLVALAVRLAPRMLEHARSLAASLGQPPAPLANARKLRMFATAALHISIVQLVLGAAFRHFRHDHILWTHIALALVVTVLGVLAGFMARTIARSNDPAQPVDDAQVPALVPWTRTVGGWAAALVGLQFMLGWAAFLAGGYRNIEAANLLQAMARTVHQANGAAMLALLTALWLCALALAPKAIPGARASSASPGGRALSA